MPMYEFECASCDRIEEHFMRHWDDPAPACETCSGPTVKRMSRFAAPFSGSIHKYTDPNKENSHIDGWWAFRKRSSVSGQPEPCYISTMEELRAFNKAEGLAAPGEIPTNATVSADGKQILSNGMPGQWAGGLPGIPARLQEMISTKAEDCSPPPGTASPAMPADYGVRVEAVPVPAEAGG